MTDQQLLNFSTDTSLFDTYFLYGIIGLLIFIALIGLIILIITSCCWCFYSVSFCFCCYHRHRHLSYKINQRFQRQDQKKKISFLKRHRNDINNFSQLYDSCPHLINNKAMLKTGINNKNLDTSCTTINTTINPITPCGSIRSFRESALSIQNNPIIRPFSYIKKLNDRVQLSRQLKSRDSVLNSPGIVSIDITQRSPSMNGTQTHSSNTNIYESVMSTSNIHSLSDRATPIYETEWTHNVQKLMMKKMPLIKNNGISVIELPTSRPDLVPSIHYFQQKQHPYDKVLANRKTTSDSMRRTNMLNKIKDDAAFLY